MVYQYLSLQREGRKIIFVFIRKDKIRRDNI